jgi:hypothetical protein
MQNYSDYVISDRFISTIVQALRHSMDSFSELLVPCIDESGKLADSRTVALAGCANTQDGWEAFRQEWIVRLRADGISHFSMKEAMHFRGPFSDWHGELDRTHKRDKLLRDLAKLIGEKTFRFACAPSAADFNTLPAEQRKRLGNDVHYAGFEGCFEAVVGQYPHAALHIICDLSEEYSERCVKLFHKLRNKNASAKMRCFGISFLDDERHAGLQAADLIAYCVRATHCGAATEAIVQNLHEMLLGKAKRGGVLYRAATRSPSPTPASAASPR